MSIQTPSGTPSENSPVPAGQAPKVYFPPVKREIKDRSAFLWLWLTILTVLTAVSIIFNVIDLINSQNALNAPSPTQLAIFGGLAVLQFFTLIGIWSWKQWGIYGFALVTVLNFVALLAFQRANYGDIPMLILSLGLLFFVTGEDQHNFD